MQIHLKLVCEENRRVVECDVLNGLILVLSRINYFGFFPCTFVLVLCQELLECSTYWNVLFLTDMLT